MSILVPVNPAGLFWTEVRHGSYPSSRTIWHWDGARGWYLLPPEYTHGGDSTLSVASMNREPLYFRPVSNPQVPDDLRVETGL